LIGSGNFGEAWHQELNPFIGNIIDSKRVSAMLSLKVRIDNKLVKTGK
jgi:hypothetical protein